MSITPPFTPFDRDLRPFAAVLRRINGHHLAHGAARHLLPGRDRAASRRRWRVEIIRPARDRRAQRLHAVINDRQQTAVLLGDGGLEDAVVHRPIRAVVGEGHGALTTGLATAGRPSAARSADTARARERKADRMRPRRTTEWVPS